MNSWSVPALLLLDVDGVINVGRPAWPDKDARALVPASGREWPMRWSPTLISRLVNLYHCGLVEIRWATTWCPYADTLNQLWGLPGFKPCWTEELFGSRAIAAKRAAAQHALDAGRRLIWCDDEAIPSAKHRRLTGMTGDALFIIPDSRTGLTPGHLRQIDAFLKPSQTAVDG